MSEFEVKRARMEVEKSTAEFEKALDGLFEQIQQSTETIGRLTDKTRDITSRVREIVDFDGAFKHLEEGFTDWVDHSVTHAEESASRLFSGIRHAAEEELAAFDTRPLMTWGAVLAGGFTLGYILARKTL